jgi:hypothetical protein
MVSGGRRTDNRDMPVGPFARSWMRNFHALMAIIACAVLVVIGIGFKLEQIHAPGALQMLGSYLLLTAMALPFLLLLRERGRPYLLDAFLTFSWALFFVFALHDLVFIAARIGAAFPYHDAQLAQVDRLFHVSVPGVNEWASRSRLGWLINQSYYPVLLPFMETAVLLPLLLGKVSYTKRFIVGNLVAFAIAIPLFILWPAVGPWTVLPLPSSKEFLTCQRELESLRHAGVFTPSSAIGVMCFPSFHVIWPILSSRSLFGFRWLRLPAIVLSVLIALSTLTTGWHYGCDVAAGIAIAAVSIVLADRVVERMPSKSCELESECVRDAICEQVSGN